jgi:hypothetical protein
MDDLPIIKEIERAFNVLNEKLFGGKIKRPAITLDIKRKVSIRFIGGVIYIGSEFPQLDLHDVLACLLHEMIHVLNFQNKVIDCTANQYHNKKYFLSVALAVGLVVSKHKAQGWSLTTTSIPKGGFNPDILQIPPKQAIQKRVKAFSEVALNRAAYNEAKAYIEANRPGPAAPCFLKYICKCPPPHNSIRSGRRPDGPHPLRITCQECGGQFTCVDE